MKNNEFHAFSWFRLEEIQNNMSLLKIQDFHASSMLKGKFYKLICVLGKNHMKYIKNTLKTTNSKIHNSQEYTNIQKQS